MRWTPHTAALAALSTMLLLAAATARADAVDALREFARDAKSGRAAFTQTVTSPDGAKKKSSHGSFEFARPERFRFTYAKPFEQTIVSDGRKVWLHDVDLNQVSVRPAAQALGATPAALLAGAELDKDFELSAQPARDGLDWVQAMPRAKESTVKQLQVGFRGKTLAALEIVDAFGTKSLLQFKDVVVNPKLPEDTFRFVVPKGVDVIEQP
ncbi:outer membrane lipoprotein chaperone LolA [Aquabacterium sp.]|uniref:outer membrane lipoprotein chaperone LolA n=1 Tax=Aquabacterium sp. TaxID=1872578 RepID=UPI002C375ECB|nr:outer membrane lipoprotein chaperone LolA [Aquabacterium sp.]HSW08271.1 outer membrane lipoprotein chaperone LolA [Aquabacterium sp.]